MKFNNGLAKKQFEKEWKKMRNEYERAGMTEEVIEAMYQYDQKNYCVNRRFMEHNQPMPDACIGGDEVAEDKSPLLNRFSESFSVDTPIGGTSRYAWIDELDNFELAGYLRNLPTERKELITLYVIDGLTQEEIAELQGVSQVAVLRKIKRIKNNLKKFV